MENVAVIVLAGGKSSRMHSPKPWLIFKNKITFLENITYSYSLIGFKNIVISLNKNFILPEYSIILNKLEPKALIISNNKPDEGRLYSLYLAINQLSNVDYVIVHNVDNPLVDSSIINALYLNKTYNGTTIPSYHGVSGHPIVIGKSIITEIITNYKKHATLKDLINKFEKKYVEVNNSTILVNINTIAEYNTFIHGLI